MEGKITFKQEKHIEQENHKDKQITIRKTREHENHMNKKIIEQENHMKLERHIG